MGNPLRGDDGAGPEVVHRLSSGSLLRRSSGPRPESSVSSGLVTAIIVEELDLSLADQIAECDHLIVVDAMQLEDDGPLRIIPIEPAAELTPPGLLTHVFDWPFLLAIAREIYGRTPTAELLAVQAERFELSEKLSPACEAAVAAAVRWLADRTTRRGAVHCAP